jgi:FKBP-type peptidyl-prolyl cis-trans isomerase
MATEARTHVTQLQALEGTRAQQAAQREDRAGQRYLARIAAMPRAHRTASGLVYVPIAQGAGAAPTATDQVTVQYTGKLIDGSVFDSSAAHGGSASFTLGRVIPCWTEGLQLMKVGGSARLICPAALAYGDHGAGGVIKPGATLDFEVKLMAVHPAPPPGNFASPLGAPPTAAPRAATPH